METMKRFLAITFVALTAATAYGVGGKDSGSNKRETVVIGNGVFSCTKEDARELRQQEHLRKQRRQELFNGKKQFPLARIMLAHGYRATEKLVLSSMTGIQKAATATSSAVSTVVTSSANLCWEKKYEALNFAINCYWAYLQAETMITLIEMLPTSQEVMVLVQSLNEQAALLKSSLLNYLPTNPQDATLIQTLKDQLATSAAAGTQKEIVIQSLGQQLASAAEHVTALGSQLAQAIKDNAAFTTDLARADATHLNDTAAISMLGQQAAALQGQVTTLLGNLANTETLKNASAATIAAMKEVLTKVQACFALENSSNPFTRFAVAKSIFEHSPVTQCKEAMDRVASALQQVLPK